jgi:hypothetical protein
MDTITVPTRKKSSTRKGILTAGPSDTPSFANATAKTINNGMHKAIGTRETIQPIPNVK